MDRLAHNLRSEWPMSGDRITLFIPLTHYHPEYRRCNGRGLLDLASWDIRPPYSDGP